MANLLRVGPWLSAQSAWLGSTWNVRDYAVPIFLTPGIVQNASPSNLTSLSWPLRRLPILVPLFCPPKARKISPSRQLFRVVENAKVQSTSNTTLPPENWSMSKAAFHKTVNLWYPSSYWFDTQLGLSQMTKLWNHYTSTWKLWQCLCKDAFSSPSCPPKARPIHFFPFLLLLEKMLLLLLQINWTLLPTFVYFEQQSQ